MVTYGIQGVLFPSIFIVFTFLYFKKLDEFDTFTIKIWLINFPVREKLLVKVWFDNTYGIRCSFTKFSTIYITCTFYRLRKKNITLYILTSFICAYKTSLNWSNNRATICTTSYFFYIYIIMIRIQMDSRCPGTCVIAAPVNQYFSLIDNN